MTPDEAYHWLIGEGDASFEKHVLASILALSLAEGYELGRPLNEMAGYDGLPELLAAMFPHAVSALAGMSALQRETDETCLFDLLLSGTSDGSALQKLLASLIARRAQRPNHLWQDLGLRSRAELSELMATHFAPLARRNRSDMKWKKFFFRTLCSDEEYVLCMAPSCGECTDFDNCFGEENGESFLAQLRRDGERALEAPR
ncbi:nitrogen fixation protein NifQ [Rhizomicrobium palustre]|uniref:Nitrogen fixation protein NifQ n=1 Tax=Rhizomicrobium palustre TaxID=189966 RepID=A0A846N0F7_9PROT|nr:nitrogen fixation protein NifQ [Rhizomicrobium palustre]NIK89176.1 nitrogen fixation protein NifQ [Rhizomicrobium palustre]